jgi:Mg2+/citrate symporter
LVYFLDRKQKEEKYSMKITKREAKRYERILGEKKVYDMTPEELERPITKQMGELCRHRLEKRWYRRLVFLNFVLIIAVIACLVIHLFTK